MGRTKAPSKSSKKTSPQNAVSSSKKRGKAKAKARATLGVSFDQLGMKLPSSRTGTATRRQGTGNSGGGGGANTPRRSARIAAGPVVNLRFHQHYPNSTRVRPGIRNKRGKTLLELSKINNWVADAPDKQTANENTCPYCAKNKHGAERCKGGMGGSRCTECVSRKVPIWRCQNWSVSKLVAEGIKKEDW